MSWTAFVAPLHAFSSDTLDWAANASFSHGIPDRIPRPQPLPTVAHLLAALRIAGCHGDPWFTIGGEQRVDLLPRCTDRHGCPAGGGRDLGEVSITVAGTQDVDRSVRLDHPVESISLRKPAGIGIMHAAAAVVAIGGPQLVFDDNADRVVVVHPSDPLDDLASMWPW